MFDIIFKKDNALVPQFSVMSSNHQTLEDAKAARIISGDLVVYHGTDTVVRLETWLWDWEKKDNNSYAYRQVHKEPKTKGLQNGCESECKV